MKILVVEDEEAIARGLRFNFEQEGYEVELAEDGVIALAKFEAASPPFDVVVLDLMLPGMSGYEVCREIRRRDGYVAVLVLSARTLSEDRSLAFDCGTDQYLSKPFALPELLSRVKNLMERRRAVTAGTTPPPPAKPPLPNSVSFGDGITVHFDRFEVTVRGVTQPLTTMELQLIRYFIENEDRVLSRNEIMEKVWGDSAPLGTRSIDNFVMRLRRLIERDPAAPQHFLSVRGTGYRFVAEPEPAEGASSSD